MIGTAAEAAVKSLAWAEAAESAHKRMDARRAEADACERGQESKAALLRGQVDVLNQTRAAAVEMSTMWAAVSHALHTAEQRPS
ncbi:hypothetical protein [Streptomyces niveus]|uniref:hypothetical protein n=1 Tax=Streptomyces niveus TaxID=193462 RepID=UPI0034181057